MRKINLTRKIAILLTGFLILVHPVFAEESVQELKKQIEELQKRVEDLESSKVQQQKNERKKDGAWGFLNHRRNLGWNPFDEMKRIQEEMNQIFQNSFSGENNLGVGMFSSNLSFNTDLDLKETKDGYEIIFDMTGLDKEKVDIEINEHSITVKGERSKQDTEKSQGRYFSSQSFGSFMKTIPLPEDADTSKVKTEKKGDALVIRMPKKKK